MKSVRTHPDHLRKGVSTHLMAHLTDYARTQGLTRLSLETHPTPRIRRRPSALRAVRLRSLRPLRRLYGCEDKRVYDAKDLSVM
ncbi:GNAT family N-acetyltransferase [Litorimonas sp. RW-G-Af-16]|uniref:GNAT family N-acetyltransferase n=1 Tax=Litorimonas sp. RW-G-Af-16 TaxID=3241168 RepID=UPI00390C4F2E